MLPRVVIHNMVSVRRRADWFTPDVGLYYEVATRCHVDAILSGSETMLEGFKDVEGRAEGLPCDCEQEESERASHGPLMVVTDSRGRIRQWALLRNQPYWRDALALVSAATPEEYLAYLSKEGVEYILTGEDDVDMRAALEELHTRYGVTEWSLLASTAAQL